MIRTISHNYIKYMMIILLFFITFSIANIVIKMDSMSSFLNNNIINLINRMLLA
jgi:hypothetical protein